MVLTILVSLQLFVVFPMQALAIEKLGKIVGQMGMVEGDVSVDGRAVKRNASLREGSVVEVKKGKATLLLGSGSVFHLSANSKMVVKQFGIRPESGKEGGDLNLTFGKTRALILNKGSETKSVNIITRTATMGVRGTEVFIDSPEDLSKPVKFYTMEGSAQVEIPKAPSIDLPQNGGISTQKLENSEQVTVSDPPVGVKQVKQEIKDNRMQILTVNTPGDVQRLRQEFNFEPPLSIPRFPFDPLQDRLTPLTVVPTFCNAANPTCP